MARLYLRLAHDIFPAKPPLWIVIGVSSFATILWGALRKVFHTGDRPWRFLKSREVIRINEFVEALPDENFVYPDWLIKDRPGKLYNPADRRNVFCFERILEAEIDLTPRDFFNPGEYDWTTPAGIQNPSAGIINAPPKGSILATIDELPEETQ